jgi:hypothetical protein
MPNFYGSGVPEYPLLIVAMPSRALPASARLGRRFIARAAACQPVLQGRDAGSNISDRFARLLTIGSVV